MKKLDLAIEYMKRMAEGNNPTYKLLEIYERTKRNCQFYEREGKKMSLLNEIGCLRGIVYCLEEVGINKLGDAELLRLISIQQEFKAKDE